MDSRGLVCFQLPVGSVEANPRLLLTLVPLGENTETRHLGQSGYSTCTDRKAMNDGKQTARDADWRWAKGGDSRSSLVSSGGRRASGR